MKIDLKKQRTPLEEVYKKYLRWEATPKTERRPFTIAEFGDLYEVTKEDILEFQQRPNFISDLSATTMQVAGEQLPQMVQGLMQSLKINPKTSELQTLIKIIKDHGSTDVGIKEYDFKSQLTNSQARDLIALLQEIIK
jgi:hypothetical protein